MSAFRLGNCEVDPTNLTIRCGDVLSQLRPRSMDVLLVLTEHAQQIVTKETLFDQTWGNTIVTDDALTQCIVELRKALADSAKSPRFIQTVRGKGFKLLLEPEWIEAARLQNSARSNSKINWAMLSSIIVLAVVLITLVFRFYPETDEWIEPNNAINRLAVLPFVNMGQAVHETFADGLTEEVIHSLAHLNNIKVISRTSAFKYKGVNADIREIGEALNVAHIIEGSVRWDKHKLRGTAQLN